MYKVFFKHRVIILGNRAESLNHQGKIYFWNKNDDLKIWLNEFELDISEDKIFLESDDIEALFTAFKNCFKYIEAAGGWVWNTDGEFLVIHRLGVWDLPKGKIEKGEKPDEAAIREVEEECGIHKLVLQNQLKSTYHIYQLKNKRILKRTYWYQMLYDGNESLIPQTEEDIEATEWLALNQLEKFKANTYASLREVVKEITQEIKP